MENNQKIVFVIGALLILVVIGAFFLSNPEEAHVYDEFAQCLSEKEVTYYGAFWCPNCQRQGAMFKKSEEFLPYVECSTPDGKEQLDVCVEAEIEAYPTWEFADGSRQIGVVDLEFLAEKTGCELPMVE